MKKRSENILFIYILGQIVGSDDFYYLSDREEFIVKFNKRYLTQQGLLSKHSIKGLEKADLESVIHQQLTHTYYQSTYPKMYNHIITNYIQSYIARGKTAFQL